MIRTGAAHKGTTPLVLKINSGDVTDVRVLLTVSMALLPAMTVSSMRGRLLSLPYATLNRHAKDDVVKFSGYVCVCLPCICTMYTEHNKSPLLG